jgi:hypothetical protein
MVSMNKFAVCRLLFAVCCLPFAVCRLLFAVCCLPFAVCRLPLVKRKWKIIMELQ